MDKLILGVVFSFILTLILLPILIKVAAVNKLFVPQNYRRIHHNKVSALGGLAIFLASTLSFILFSDLVNYPDYRMIFSSAFLMFALGIRDDIFEVTPWIKLIGQTLAILILVLFAHVNIYYFQHFVPEPYGVLLDYLSTIILMLLIINAYNLIDGIDLLAATVGVVILGMLGIWFFLVVQYDYSLALLSLSSALLAFMFFNYSPAKIFMGDTGTMTIGLIMSMSLIQFDSINTLIDSPYKFRFAPAIAFSFIALMIFDMLRVAGQRIIKHHSPFRADKTHIHHLLLRIGWPHYSISIFIGATILFQVALSIFLDSILKSNWAIILVNILFLGVFYAFIYLLLLKNNASKVEKKS